jgi:pathogenesis-related protein 1
MEHPLGGIARQGRAGDRFHGVALLAGLMAWALAGDAAAAGSRMSVQDIGAISAWHNKVRKEVGVGPLKWSPKLATYAQQWSNHLAKTACQMQHRTEHKYGENLFQGTAGHYRAVDAAKAWESEKSLYPGGPLTESSWHPAGHYTQMVWRGTKRFGCGESYCRKTLIVACNYDPPGNVLGRSPY